MLLSKISNGIKWNLFGKTTYAAVGFLLTTVLARWLGPSQYGVYLILTSIVTMFQIIGFLGFETGLLKYIPEYNIKNDSSQIRRLFLAFVLIRLAVSFIIAFFIILFAGFLVKTVFARAQLQFRHLWLFLLVILPLSLNGLFRNLLDSLYKQKILNIIDAAGIFLRLGLTAVFLKYFKGISVVIIASAITECLILAALAINVRRIFSFKFDGLPANFKKVLFFSLTIWISNIAGQLLGRNSDIFLLGMFVRPDIVGSYGLSYALANMAFMFFLFPIGNMVLIAVSEIYSKNDSQRLTEFTSMLFKYYAFFIFPVLAGGEVLAGNFIGIIYGQHYINAAIFFQIFLCLFAVNILFGGTAGSILPGIGAYRILLWGQVFGILSIIINLLLIPRFGAWGAIAGAAVISLSSTIFFITMLAKRMRIEFPLKFFLKVIFSALIMGISLLPFRAFISGPFKLFVSICMGLFIYIFVLRICKPFTQRDIYLFDNSSIPAKRFIRRVLFR